MSTNKDLTRKTMQDGPEFNSTDLVKTVFSAALEKKASDVLALDMSDLLVVTDYFVLATGNTDIQVSAIAAEIEKEVQEQHGMKPVHREGVNEGKWVLLDYLDIVVHLFQPDFREEYRIEDLWSQAKKLRAEALMGEKNPPTHTKTAESAVKGTQVAK